MLYIGYIYNLKYEVYEDIYTIYNFYKYIKLYNNV